MTSCELGGGRRGREPVKECTGAWGHAKGMCVQECEDCASACRRAGQGRGCVRATWEMQEKGRGTHRCEWVQQVGSVLWEM